MSRRDFPPCLKQYCASPTAVVDALTAAAFLGFLVGARSRSQVRRPKQLAPSSVPWLWQASPLVVAAWLWLLLLLQHHTSDRIGSHLTSPHPCVRAVLPPCAALTRTPRRRKRIDATPSSSMACADTQTESTHSPPSPWAHGHAASRLPSPPLPTKSCLLPGRRVISSSHALPDTAAAASPS